MISPLPNLTFIWQLLIFLVVTISLTYLVFKPTLKIIQKRRELTLGKQTEAKDLQTEADILMKKYEEQLEEMRTQGSEIQKELIRQGNEVAEEIIKRAKLKNKEMLTKSLDELNKQKIQASQEMEKQASNVSQDIISKIMS